MAGFDINNNGYQVERNGFQQNKIVGNEGKQGKKVEVDLNATHTTHTTHKTETKEYGNELLTSSNVPDEFKNFIYRIIPNHYRSKACCNSHGRLICNDEYMSPQGILEKDEFFKELRR